MTAPKEAFYDERIAPLMGQIIELCKEARINMAAQFSLGYDPDADSTLFCSTTLPDLDAEDERGTERMMALRRVMYPPSPVAFAFTIISRKDSP
ncbi:MAG: hypothetical protein IMZ46_07835 [Acidobacteria bacterium]|nr:hypothetical protein [Acidobacteriota bacterium]